MKVMRKELRKAKRGAHLDEQDILEIMELTEPFASE
jgi:hypothetical protein